MKSEREIQFFQARLSAEIKRLRISLEISKSELSQRTGISRQGIRLIEECERSPSVATLWQLANGLDICASKILASIE